MQTSSHVVSFVTAVSAYAAMYPGPKFEVPRAVSLAADFAARYSIYILFIGGKFNIVLSASVGEVSRAPVIITRAPVIITRASVVPSPKV